jgi:hypothetical protein
MSRTDSRVAFREDLHSSSGSNSSKSRLIVDQSQPMFLCKSQLTKMWSEFDHLYECVRVLYKTRFM